MKGIMLLIIALVISFNAIGQEGYFTKTTEERARIQTDWMKDELQIDKLSISKVYQVNLKFARKAEGIKTVSGNKWKLIRKIKNLNEKKTKELSKVLSKEQFAIYVKRKSEIRVKIASAIFQILDKKLSENKMILFPENRNQLVSDWMKNELLLDSLTAEKVSQLNLKYAKKLNEIGDQNSKLINKIGGFLELQQLRDKELSTILSKNQFDEYIIKKKEIRDKFHHILYSKENTENSAETCFERAKLQTDWMKAKFQLDSVTSDKVFDVNLKYAQKVDDLNSKSDLMNVNQLIQLLHEKDNDLKMVFSQEQYEKYSDWKKKIKENSRNIKLRENSKRNQI